MPLPEMIQRMTTKLDDDSHFDDAMVVLLTECSVKLEVLDKATGADYEVEEESLPDAEVERRAEEGKLSPEAFYNLLLPQALEAVNDLIDIRRLIVARSAAKEMEISDKAPADETPGVIASDEDESQEEVKGETDSE